MKTVSSCRWGGGLKQAALDAAAAVAAAGVAALIA